MIQDKLVAVLEIGGGDAQQVRMDGEEFSVFWLDVFH